MSIRRINPNMDIDPLSLEKRATLYRQVRDKRLEMKHEMEEMQSLETRLKDSLLEDIEVDTGHIFGGYAFSVVSKEKPALDDWNDFIQGVVASGRYDMLQKRLADKAVTDTADWHKLPGVKRIFVKSLSVTKR